MSAVLDTFEGEQIYGQGTSWRCENHPKARATWRIGIRSTTVGSNVGMIYLVCDSCRNEQATHDISIPASPIL